LKRGESIGPVTKAALEETENAEASDNKDKGDTVATEDDLPKACIDSTPDSPASTITEIPLREKPGPQKTSESEDNSDSTSTNSDIPATPDSTDAASSNADVQPDELIEANVQEATELRGAALNMGSITTIEKAVSATMQITDEPEKIETEKLVDDKPAEMAPEEYTEVVIPGTDDEVKIMEGWEMLQMLLRWILNEFAADEEALARQLANNEISYRFLWLYYVPGSLISLQDPISKQQMAARVSLPCM